MMKNTTLLNRLVASVGALSVVLASACTADAGGADSGQENPNSALPAKLVVATGDYKVPTHFRNDAGELDGLSIDLMSALGKRMGVEVEFTAVPFDAVLAGIAAGRYDAAIFNVSDTYERQKVVDFADYALSGSVIVTKNGERKGITTDLRSLCGRSLAIKAGQHEFQVIKEKVQPKCKEAGREPIQLETFKDDSSTRFAVSSGRVDAMIGGATTMPYVVEQNSEKFELVGRLSVDSAPIGIPVDKGNHKIVRAFQSALKEVYRDGTYQRIFKEWGMESIIPTDVSFFKINRGKGFDGGESQ